jgi:hypothetical protein
MRIANAFSCPNHLPGIIWRLPNPRQMLGERGRSLEGKGVVVFFLIFMRSASLALERGTSRAQSRVAACAAATDRMLSHVQCQAEAGSAPERTILVSGDERFSLVRRGCLGVLTGANGITRLDSAEVLPLDRQRRTNVCRCADRLRHRRWLGRRKPARPAHCGREP